MRIRFSWTFFCVLFFFVWVVFVCNSHADTREKKKHKSSDTTNELAEKTAPNKPVEKSLEA